jgi:hypothetical protein
MSTRLLGRPTGTSPIVSARHSSFPRAWSPNEARWEPRRGVIPELLLDRTAFWGRQQPASLDKTLIARGHRPPPGANCHNILEKRGVVPHAIVYGLCRPEHETFSSAAPGHAVFSGRGMNVWQNDVLELLSRHLGERR